jgi:hypothetical protein
LAADIERAAGAEGADPDPLPGCVAEFRKTCANATM